MLDRVRDGQGVRAVAASSTAPLTGAPNRGMRIEGDPVLPPDQQPNADFQLITPDYFRALGITLVAGRTFDATDRADTPPVLVVNQALVDKYFAGRDPIGHVILFGGNKRHEIVGVVADARYRTVEQPADPTFYLPLEQNDERWPFLAFTVWTDGDDGVDDGGGGAAPLGGARGRSAAADLAVADDRRDPVRLDGRSAGSTPGSSGCSRRRRCCWPQSAPTA